MSAFVVEPGLGGGGEEGISNGPNGLGRSEEVRVRRPEEDPNECPRVVVGRRLPSDDVVVVVVVLVVELGTAIVRAWSLASVSVGRKDRRGEAQR